MYMYLSVKVKHRTDYNQKNHKTQITNQLNSLFKSLLVKILMSILSERGSDKRDLQVQVHFIMLLKSNLNLKYLPCWDVYV